MIDIEEMTPVERAEWVKSTYSCLDLLDDLEIEAVGGKIRSPFNEHDGTPSCHIYEDHWHDYSTGRWGDVVDLAMALTGWTWGKTLAKLSAGAVRNDSEPGHVARATPAEPVDMTATYRAARRPGDGRLGERWAPNLPGVPLWFLDRLTVADHLAENNDGDLLIPHWTGNGIVTGIKVRRRQGGKVSHPGSVFSAGLYTTQVPSGSPRAVITEGESDCWALTALLLDEADVYALPSGANLWRDAWLDQLGEYDVIYTAFDNDRAGEQATDKVRRAIGWGRWKAIIVPTMYNDVREAIAAGWHPSVK